MDEQFYCPKCGPVDAARVPEFGRVQCPDCRTWLMDNIPDHFTALQAENAKLRKVAEDLVALINNSHGVAGLHLNGDGAPWDELLAGGRFEDWLRSLSDAGYEL
jgi:hypothetical protein